MVILSQWFSTCRLKEGLKGEKKKSPGVLVKVYYILIWNYPYKTQYCVQCVYTQTLGASFALI